MTKPTPRNAINLRLDGFSFDDIAASLGVDHATAIELIQRALVTLPDLLETDKNIIAELELSRLDALQFPLF